MNVYVESNFVLELTLLQEEHESCERILALSERGRIQFIIPAYSFAEPNEPLGRRERDRKELARQVENELSQLARSIPYKTESTAFQEVVSLLRRIGSEERQRFAVIRDRLLQSAEVIPLDAAVLASAATCERQFGLSPQDALVFASIVQHLKENPAAACFLTLNSKDFDDIDLRKTLALYNCKLLFSFSDGYGYIQSQI